LDFRYPFDGHAAYVIRPTCRPISCAHMDTWL